MLEKTVKQPEDQVATVLEKTVKQPQVAAVLENIVKQPSG